MASTSTEPQFHPSLLEIAAILRRPEFLFAITYLAVLLCLLHYQSLWVDEIMQLIGTRSGDLSNTDELVRTGSPNCWPFAFWVILPPWRGFPPLLRA
jgi:hypothetical protein